MQIRTFEESEDWNQLRECVIELQDFERGIDPRLPSGADCVDAYIPQMRAQCRKSSGRVLVAEVDEEIAGYTVILTRVKSEQVQDGAAEHGLVADLVILKKFQKMGFGQQLLDAAEAHAVSSGVRSLRIGVLASNGLARNLYSAAGFVESYVELEKDLMPSGGTPQVAG